MIEVKHIGKRYADGRDVLSNVSCTISAGDMLFVSGHSGAGKTTLIKLIATLEKPSSGSVVINGQNVASLKASALPYVRRHFGVVFQDQKLLFDRSALDNVMLPLQIAGFPYREACRRAEAALDRVGLRARAKANPVALSGGEQQRLSIARAVVNRPSVLVADEPTGNLDSVSAEQVMSLFSAFHQVGVTVIVATHDQSWISRNANAKRIVLHEGRVLA